MKKTIWKILAVVVVLLIAAAIVGALMIDSAVKRGVEVFGPKVAKVPITLDSVKLSVLSGNGTIRGLIVGNPEGYKTDSAIKVGSASMGVRIGSILSDKIVVRSIKIETTEINFEGGLRDNNLRKILANIEEFVGKGGDTGQPPAGAKPAKKLQIDEIVIAGAKVSINLTGREREVLTSLMSNVRPGATLSTNPMTLNLPEVRLENLGQGPEGITPADATRKVIQAILGEATKLVANSLSQIGQDALSNAAGGTKEVTKGAREAAEKAAKGAISDLFKKKE